MQCLSPQVPPLSQCCHGAISLLPCICHVHVRAGFGTSYIRMQQNHAMLLSSSGNSNALQWLSQKLCGASRQHCCRRHHNCASARRSSRYAGPASSVGLSQSSEMSSRCSSKSCSCWWRPSPSSCTRDGLVGNTESGAVQPARSQASAPQGNRLDRRCSSKCQLCSSTPSTLQVINPSSCLTHRTRQPQRSAAQRTCAKRDTTPLVGQRKPPLPPAATLVHRPPSLANSCATGCSLPPLPPAWPSAAVSCASPACSAGPSSCGSVGVVPQVSGLQQHELPRQRAQHATASPCTLASANQ